LISLVMKWLPSWATALTFFQRKASISSAYVLQKQDAQRKNQFFHTISKQQKMLKYLPNPDFFLGKVRITWFLINIWIWQLLYLFIRKRSIIAAINSWVAAIKVEHS
jgi:hypothetical protein